MVRTEKAGSQAAAASAAAMDELNLDDFLAGEDGVGDSIFDELDLDLGDMSDLTGGLTPNNRFLTSSTSGGGRMNLEFESLAVEVLASSASPLDLDALKAKEKGGSKKKVKRKKGSQKKGTEAPAEASVVPALSTAYVEETPLPPKELFVTATDAKSTKNTRSSRRREKSKNGNEAPMHFPLTPSPQHHKSEVAAPREKKSTNAKSGLRKKETLKLKELFSTSSNSQAHVNAPTVSPPTMLLASASRTSQQPSQGVVSSPGMSIHRKTAKLQRSFLKRSMTAPSSISLTPTTPRCKGSPTSISVSTDTHPTIPHTAAPTTPPVQPTASNKSHSNQSTESVTALPQMLPPLPRSLTRGSSTSSLQRKRGSSSYHSFTPMADPPQLPSAASPASLSTGGIGRQKLHLLPTRANVKVERQLSQKECFEPLAPPPSSLTQSPLLPPPTFTKLASVNRSLFTTSNGNAHCTSSPCSSSAEVIKPSSSVTSAPAATPVTDSRSLMAPASPPPKTTKSSNDRFLSKVSQERTELLNSSFCGLDQSKSIFFPFMSIPSEVAMRRCHKLFPLLDKICTITALSDHSALSGIGSSNQRLSTKSAPTAQEKRDPLFKLFVDVIGVGGNHHHHISSSGPDVSPRQAAPDGSNNLTNDRSNDALLVQNLTSARATISNVDRQELQMELLAALALLQRQSDFMGQSLNNMNTWCKSHFSAADYESVYNGELSTLPDLNFGENKRRRRSSTAQLQSHSDVVAVSQSVGEEGRALMNESTAVRQSPMGKEKTTLSQLENKSQKAPHSPMTQVTMVTVKVKCAGFKDSCASSYGGTHGPLLALLSLPSVQPSFSELASSGMLSPRTAPAPPIFAASNTNNAAAIGTNRELHLFTSDSTVLLPTVSDFREAHSSKIFPQQKPYESLDSTERQKYIANAVLHDAQAIEESLATVKRRREAELRKREECRNETVDTENELLRYNTRSLWKFIENTSYFDEITEESVKNELAVAWHPEISDRDMYWNEMPTPCIKKRKVGDTGTDNRNHLSASLFGRLQSLLVSESDDDDNDSSEQFGHPHELNGAHQVKRLNDTLRMEARENGVKSNSPSSFSNRSDDDFLDVSALSLDQRAYIQLRALQLIDQPFLPLSQPAVIEEYDSTSDSDEIENTSTISKPLDTRSKLNSNDNDDVDLDTIIRRMQIDLSDMHRHNNSRAAFLQSAANAQIAESCQKEARRCEQATLLARYAQLVKKQKQIKIEAAKVITKDESWIPW